MAITLIQSAGNTGAGVLAFPAPNQSGSMAVVIVDSSAIAVTDSNGNIYQSLPSFLNFDNTLFGQVFFAANIKAGANTVTIVFDPGNIPINPDMIVAEFSGVGALDVSNSASGDTDSQDSGNIDTTQSSELLLGIYIGVGATSITQGAGWTLGISQPAILPPGGNGIAFEWRVVSSTGTYNATFSTSHAISISWGAQISGFFASPVFQQSNVYSGVSFSAAKQQLANRLNDPSKTCWPDFELGMYIQDAIRFWNCLTGDNRVAYPLQLSTGTVWYDLQTIKGSPRQSLLNSVDISRRVISMLLESSNGGMLVSFVLPTLQFSIDDIAQSIQRKRDEFLFKAGCTSSIEALAVTPNTSSVSLPQTVIQARRGYWLPASLPGFTPQAFPLPKNDELATTCYTPFAATPGQPQVFSAGVEPPLKVEIIPPPASPGQIELITSESQSAIPDSGVLVPVSFLMPNDFIPALTWGALADLLMINIQAQDVQRATYARQRFEEYIEILTAYPFVYGARIAGLPAIVDAVETLDIYAPSWRTAGTSPAIVGISGQNLVAFPSSQVQSLVLLMTANANVPINDADNIQLGDEVLDVILDEAASVALFKQGGAEAMAGAALHGNIIKLAAKRRDKIRAMSFFADVLQERPQREAAIAPLEISAE